MSAPDLSTREKNPSSLPSSLDMRMTRLRKNAARLKQAPVSRIIDDLDRVATAWLDPQNPTRHAALKSVVRETGYPESIVSGSLNATFAQLQATALNALIKQEFGSLRILDEFVPYPGGAIHAAGPDLTLHILAGNIPGPSVIAIAYSLLVKSSVLAKAAEGESLLARAFTRSLKTHAPLLASCVSVESWKGGDELLENAAFRAADLIVASGSTEAIESIRACLPGSARLIAYGHRISLGAIGHELLRAESLPALVEMTAKDVCTFDQQGCLSPHMFFLEKGGVVTPLQFAAALASALEKQNQRLPRRPLSLEEHAAIRRTRAEFEFKKGARVWSSASSTRWTVIYDPSAEFRPSCLNRTVFVIPINRLERLPSILRPHRIFLDTVALAVAEKRLKSLSLSLSEAGVTRICRLGRMNLPSGFWPHDGRPNLSDLVLFTFVEK